MSWRHPPARHGAVPVWLGLVAVQVIVCLGIGLVSTLIPDDSSPLAGYYDGDGDDDAVATPERLGGAVDLILDTWSVALPLRTRTFLGLSAASVSPPRPGAREAPLLRSPPA